MEAFTHYVKPGRTAEGTVYIRISWDGLRLSITGSEGPNHCGQITDVLSEPMDYAGGWDHGLCLTLATVWGRWHLNDMRAGTAAQMAHLRLSPKDAYRETHPGNWYGWACERLDAANLLNDNGYRFGSAWLREDVPEAVLSFLHGLPTVDRYTLPRWAK